MFVKKDVIFIGLVMGMSSGYTYHSHDVHSIKKMIINQRHLIHIIILPVD